jgi:hypothetical protein
MKSVLAVGILAIALSLAVSPVIAQSLPEFDAYQVAQVDGPPDFVAIAEGFINDLATSDYDAAIATYNTDAATNVTESSLIQTWQDIVAQSGEFQQQVNAQAEPVASPNEPALVIITGRFANECRDLFVIIDSNQEVIGLDAASGEPLNTCQ